MTKERLHIKGTSCLLPHHSAIIWLMYIFTVSHLRLELKKNPGSVYHDINSPPNQIWCVCRGWRVQISGSNHCSSGPAVPTKVDVLLSKLNHFFLLSSRSGTWFHIPPSTLASSYLLPHTCHFKTITESIGNDEPCDRQKIDRLVILCWDDPSCGASATTSHDEWKPAWIPVVVIILYAGRRRSDSTTL